MSNFSWLRPVFFRILVNIPVGILGAFAIFMVLKSNFQIERNCSLFQEVLNTLKDDFNLKYFFNKEIWLLVLLIFYPIFIVIGEIYCLAGELIIDFYFDYYPLKNLEENKKIKLEKIYPCSEKYLYFNEIVKAKDSYEESELHYALSRMLSGLMVVFLSFISILIPFIILILHLCLCPILINLIKKLSENLKILIIIILAIIILKFLDCLSFKNYDFFYYFVIIALSFLAFIGSLYYRAHANWLTKAETIENKNKNKNCNP